MDLLHDISGGPKSIALTNSSSAEGLGTLGEMMKCMHVILLKSRVPNTEVRWEEGSKMR